MRNWLTPVILFALVPSAFALMTERLDAANDVQRLENGRPVGPAQAPHVDLVSVGAEANETTFLVTFNVVGTIPSSPATGLATDYSATLDVRGDEDDDYHVVYKGGGASLHTDTSNSWTPVNATANGSRLVISISLQHMPEVSHIRMNAAAVETRLEGGRTVSLVDVVGVYPGFEFLGPPREVGGMPAPSGLLMLCALFALVSWIRRAAGGGKSVLAPGRR